MIPTNGLMSFPEEKVSDQTMSTYLYDFDEGDFVLKDGKLVRVEGADAIRIWVEKLLRTEKGLYTVYGKEDYGTNVNDLVMGNILPLDFVRAELERIISEAIMIHPQIFNVTDFNITRENEVLAIGFTINHEFEVNLNV